MLSAIIYLRSVGGKRCSSPEVRCTLWLDSWGSCRWKILLPTARPDAYVALCGDNSKSAVDINTPQSRLLQDQTLAVPFRTCSRNNSLFFSRLHGLNYLRAERVPRHGRTLIRTKRVRFPHSGALLWRIRQYLNWEVSAYFELTNPAYRGNLFNR